MSDDPKWREMPLLREFHRQWFENRGDAAAGKFQRPFARDWETLLKAAGLSTAEQQKEADHDARLLAKVGLLQLTTDKNRTQVIRRVALPLGTEARFRTLFPEFQANRSEPFEWHSIAWEPEMRFVIEARMALAPEDLVRLNAFFKSGGRHRPKVPIKERSLQIFDDEKRLDFLLGSTLFRPDRLTLDLLRCEIVGEPFGWQRGPTDTGIVLVVEKAATWHSYSRWNAERRFFSAVVHGPGHGFVESIRHLGLILAEFQRSQRVLYFGDIDPQGLRIPVEASAKAQRHGLPAIEPDRWSYRQLLGIGREAATLCDAGELIGAREFEWLAELATPVRMILNSGKRLAQEHIGWEYLARQNDWHAGISAPSRRPAQPAYNPVLRSTP